MWESEASTAIEIGALHCGWTNSGTDERSLLGRTHEWGPRDGFSRTLESISERSQHPSCRTNEFPVEINHPEELLKTGLVCWLRKGGDGGGVLQ